jgi:hypothetical protein
MKRMLSGSPSQMRLPIAAMAGTASCKFAAAMAAETAAAGAGAIEDHPFSMADAWCRGRSQDAFTATSSRGGLARDE